MFEILKAKEEKEGERIMKGKVEIESGDICDLWVGDRY